LRAKVYLEGEALIFAEVDAPWKKLVGEDDLSLARAVLAHIRSANNRLDGLSTGRSINKESWADKRCT